MTTDAKTGVVVGSFEHNGYSDSDFYAIVWTGDGVRIVEIGSTRHAGTFHPGPPATADQDQAARLWIIDRLCAAMLAAESAEGRAAARDVHVRSTTTRGKNHGATGHVRRLTTTTIRGTQRRRAFVELDDADGARWMDADRLERTTPHIPDPAEVRSRAAEIALYRPWLDLIHLAGLRKGAWF
jgi:hypothetical protein